MGTFGMLLPEGVPKKKMKSIGWPHINRIVHRDGGRRRQDTTFTSVRARASQDMPGRCRESGSEGHCSSMDTERNAPVVRFLDECFLHPAFFPPGAFELKLEVPFRISFGLRQPSKQTIQKSQHRLMRYAPSPSRIQRARRKTKKQRDGYCTVEVCSCFLCKLVPLDAREGELKHL